MSTDPNIIHFRKNKQVTSYLSSKLLTKLLLLGHMKLSFSSYTNWLTQSLF